MAMIMVNWSWDWGGGVATSCASQLISKPNSVWSGSFEHMGMQIRWHAEQLERENIF